MKMKYIVLQFVFSLWIMPSLFSQQTDSIHEATDDLIIPSADLYQNTWGGENTRLRTNLLNNQTDYILPLQIDGENAFVFPCVNKTYVCSSYGMRSGRMHTGMDIKQKLGDSIVAAWDGVVRMAKKNYYAYGGTLVIRHANGLETLYSHLSDINVVENQEVKAGDLIGKAGRTGRASAEHLHFEIRFLYEHFNPKTIIDFKTFSLFANTLYVQNGKFRATNSISIDDDIVPTDGNNLTLDSANESQFILSQEEIIEKTTENKIEKTIENRTEKTTENKTEKTIENKTHIVQKGDTLYSISKKYNISIPQICKLNNLADEDKIFIGQELKLK